MARVVVLIPDLLFGSQVQGALEAAGYEVDLVGRTDRAEERLSPAAGVPVPAVLIVDLASPEFDGVTFVSDLADKQKLAGIRTLGLYPHVDDEMRWLAERANFDRVVPRSRMSREGADLVTRLISNR